MAVAFKRERYFLYNDLACLAFALQGKWVTIDLRNECCVYGKVNTVDGYMNVTMSDAVFTNPRGQHYLFESFFLMNRQIRYFHIPEEMDIIPAIKKQIEKLGKKDDTYRRVQRKK
ncbi:U7 snRNA-associated Sm-like protein LSm10 [Schistocerca cancellata]|uniref:U7 snRNA-associated Sm-like protein LSm10 n=1 Tax=Schistocerca cancellata TaxID=274614 RepID=UPI0021193EFD|nr:U7 snRNA-associated Sm-like protein LSm10 [Schistocerca cancellata]